MSSSPPLPLLPEEIILRILYFAIVRSSPQTPITLDQGPRHPSSQPPLTRTCHLFRREGLKLFYKENYFHVIGDWAGSYCLYRWVESVPEECVGLVEKLYCNWSSAGRPYETTSFRYFVLGMERLVKKVPLEWTAYVKKNQRNQVLLAKHGSFEGRCRIRVVRDLMAGDLGAEWFDVRRVNELPFDLDARTGWWFYEDEN